MQIVKDLGWILYGDKLLFLGQGKSASEGKTESVGSWFAAKGRGTWQENDFTVMAHKEKGPVVLKGGITPGTYPYLIEPAGAAMAADPNVIVH